VLERSRQQDRHGRVQTGPTPTVVPAARGLSPARLLALRRTAGNRAARQYLQRMTVAIDGHTDNAASKRATRAVWGLGWLGVTSSLDAPLTGKIKLVSCHSAADSRHRLATDTAQIYPFNRSYAETLARALAPTSPKDPFRPTSVQGINGIGWVDEISGAITAIDKGRYDAASATMSDNSDVGALPTAGTTANPFTGESDPARRGAAIHAVFGAPVEAKVDPQGALRTGKGEWGKRRFAVGTGVEV